LQNYFEAVIFQQPSALKYVLSVFLSLCLCVSLYLCVILSRSLFCEESTFSQ